MKTNWQTKKLGEVCDFEGGSQPPKVNFIHEPRKGYVRFLQIRDFGSDKYITYIPDSNKNRHCTEEDILLGRYGASVGKILINKKGAYNVAVMKTIPNLDILDKKYFYFYLISDEFQKRLRKVAARSAQAGFSKDDIYDFPIIVSPIPEQHRIVKILDEVFADIAKAKENAEKNLQNAKDLFESYLQSVFANPGKDWEEKKIEDICGIKHGFAFKSQHFTQEGEYVLLTPGNFFEKGGYRDRGEKQKYYKGEIPSGFVLQKDDLLIAMTEQAIGLLGSPIIVPESDTFLHNQRLGLVNFKNPNDCSIKFVFYLFNTQKIRNLIEKTATGVKVRHTSPKKILEITVAIPPLSEQKSIVAKLDTLSAETKKLETIYKQKLADLEELKKSVLKKAFAGEL